MAKRYRVANNNVTNDDPGIYIYIMIIYIYNNYIIIYMSCEPYLVHNAIDGVFLPRSPPSPVTFFGV